jgi:hypothetical protein
MTVIQYSHSPYSSKLSLFSSPSVWFNRMMSRVSSSPFALSEARRSPMAASRCVSRISSKLTPWRM